MGFEPMTPTLPRLCATSAPRGHVAHRASRIGGALERRETFVRRWPEQDSNLRRRKPTDLQSVPVVHFGIWPCRACMRMWRAAAVARPDSATGYYRCFTHSLSRRRMYLLRSVRDRFLAPRHGVAEAQRENMTAVVIFYAYTAVHDLYEPDINGDSRTLGRPLPAFGHPPLRGEGQGEHCGECAYARL
jgi:hypothetical protein